jgi:hypothetical protein
MATFDQLSAEQRAIIELVLQRGQSYSQLADMLAMREARVRELAHQALEALAPVTAPRVEADWRGQIADYVLGQQSGPESTATRGHLRRSEPARVWAGSLLDSLETLYSDGALPQVPEAERVRERRPRREREPRPREAEPAAPLSPEAREAVRRRRLLGIVGAGALVAIVLFVWPVGLLTGDDDDDGAEQASGPAAPVPGGRGPAGIAIIAERGGERQVIVQAAGLEPNAEREAYEVWLYNSPDEAQSLGAQVTDQQGTYQGAGPLPDNFGDYEFVDVSREPINDDQQHSGQSILRGRIGKLREPPGDAREDQSVILGQVVLRPPEG